MRRKVGVASLSSSHATSYTALSASILTQQLNALLTTHKSLQQTLASFAQTHKHQILSDPLFRQRVTELCLEIGVDPLARERDKGVLTLGGTLGLREWTLALAVQVVDVCRAESPRTGGLIEIGELLRLVSKLRGEEEKASPVLEADIRRAISLLKPLRTYNIISLPSNLTFVQSSPLAQGDDTTSILQCCAESEGGWITQGTLWEWTRKKEGKPWNVDRVRLALDIAESDRGVLWRAERTEEEGGDRFYLPALFTFDS